MKKNLLLFLLILGCANLFSQDIKKSKSVSIWEECIETAANKLARSQNLLPPQNVQYDLEYTEESDANFLKVWVAITWKKSFSKIGEKYWIYGRLQAQGECSNVQWETANSSRNVRLEILPSDLGDIELEDEILESIGVGKPFKLAKKKSF